MPLSINLCDASPSEIRKLLYYNFWDWWNEKPRNKKSEEVKRDVTEDGLIYKYIYTGS